MSALHLTNWFMLWCGTSQSGKVLNYGRVAELLGMPHGAREVGWAMAWLQDKTPYPGTASSTPRAGSASKDRQKEPLNSARASKPKGSYLTNTRPAGYGPGISGTRLRPKSKQIIRQARGESRSTT